MLIKNNLVTKREQLLLLVWIVIFSFGSCKDNRNQGYTSRVENEWEDKIILFPENVSCSVLGKDTLPELCDEIFRKEFKILLYVDSAGCSDCRLKLLEWQQLIAETDILYPGKVGFLFYFQPKSMEEMTDILMINGFDYPVFIDADGSIDYLNRFPQPTRVRLSQHPQAALNHCFLLDEDNKVLDSGNPTVTSRIWESFKYEIEAGNKTSPKIITTVEVDKTIHDFGTVRKSESNPAVFTITNIGDNPLVISRISASCGCTNVIWDRQPIASGNSTTIQIEITLAEAGSFSKNLVVYCNASESPIILTLRGIAR
jgi:hypothetical protein